MHEAMEPLTETVSSTAVALLAMMRLKGIGRRKALAIVDGPLGGTDPKNCCEALMPRLAGGRLDRISVGEFHEAWRESEELVHRGRDIGVQAVSFHDTGYPARLRRIPDPPAVLFVRGDADGLHAEKGLAVVGTREPTSYGRTVALRSARNAVKAGYVIVSGLARGCDAFAHEGCLEAGGIGVAVLAHGLDKVYPAANRGLADRLLESGGCLASEYPVGTAPVRAAFAERDRLQSGLSDAVLVIETAVRGGTMHTVRFAREQGRPIACVDHPERLFNEDKVRGNQQLIRDGHASPIADVSGLNDFLEGLRPDPPADSGTEPTQEADKGQQTFVF